MEHAQSGYGPQTVLGPLREPLRLESPADPEHRLRATALRLDEDLGLLWRADVDAAQPAGTAALDPQRLVGAAMDITLERRTDCIRTWSGLITACECEPAGATWRRWRLTVEHPLARLGLNRRSRLVRDRDAAGLVRELTRARIELRTPPPKREQLVQWRESDLAWCLRLLEHEGIALVCDGDGAMLTDHPHGFPLIDEALPWLPMPQEHPAPIDPALRPSVRAWRQRLRAGPDAAAVRDWHWRTPQEPIARRADVSGGEGGEARDDGSHHRSGSEAGRLAQIRAEELLCARSAWHGEADHPGLGAGRVLRIAAPDEPVAEGSWLLTAVRHRAQQVIETGAGGAGGGNTYRCGFDAWPADRPWRPQRRTPVPRIPGLVHAVVDGPAAAVYADIDGDGCYRVRPAFDADGAASMPVRLSTPYAGDDHGLHLPLHPGTEVLLAHIDGDPDRPVIAGAVPNPTHPSVVADGNASQCVLRSAGGNELVLEDALGREVWRTTAVRDRRASVGGDDDAQVRGNRTATIGGSDTLAVQGDANVSVGRASAETVAGAKALTVGGAMQVSVGGVLNTTVAGALAEQVGAARSEVVAGTRSLAVGGDHEVSVRGDQQETTTGKRQMRAKRLRIAVEDELVLSCGKASITLKRNGDVTISGGAISVTGSGAVSVKGSKVKAN